MEADPRYKGSILVAPQDPQAAVKEIERYASNPDMVQIFLPTMSGSAFGKRHYWPLYEVAEHYGLPIATHPGGEAAGINSAMIAIDIPSYYMDWHTGLDQVYQRHAISLVAEGSSSSSPS